jgi:rhamnogalacturonan endolyase
VKVDTGAWEKIYGPFMIYLNAGKDTDELWADAKSKAAAERAAWPCEWLQHPLYPRAAERGTVTGRLRIEDPQDPAASPASAWVGLAAATPDWQQQSADYQYWVHADKNGAFTIPHVRAGTYTLYAFTDGVMDEFRRDGVKVESGRAVELPLLEWNPVRHGRQVWQIGTPDRTAKEFRHGDGYREWGLWKKYPEEFPHDVDFAIGQSHERTDWNFAQCTVQKDGDWVGTKWNIRFVLPAAPPSGTATLRLALAAAHRAVLRVSVNGKQVGLRRVDTDNAMMRAGIHGQYSQWDVAFASGLLRAGPNTVTLEQQGGRSMQRNVMYDCLRLELAGAK